MRCFPPCLQSRTGSVTRILRGPDVTVIPESVAPAPDATSLDHILFALKHEGVNLQILAQALPMLRLRQGLMRDDGGDKIMAQVLNCVSSMRGDIALCPAGL